ncbi:MAG: ATP synthase F0 subunit B [Omnitrophica bacterium RIFCSPLOWO2_12_FULL_50_11]|nr:MAG: ATP synthase F0 subunit B [Omnitrophica bacterium RIFCSPLOWO2_12_FULL_50_11]
MNISIPEILTQAVAFTLLVLLLKKFAWGPLLQLLDDRREKIARGLEEIENTKREVENLKADYERRETHIQEEARAKIQAAVDEGKRIAREIQDRARTEARAVLEKAKEDIHLETEKAKAQLRDEIADLTLAATERLINEKMDDKKDKALVLDFISDLEKLK